MPPAAARRVALALASATLALAASCSSTREATEVPDAPRRPQTVDAEGIVPEYCPKIALREGTAVLRKGEVGNLQYVASITQTSRECRVRDGELFMKVGAAGRVVAGPSGQGGTAALPIRIAVVSGADVLYANRATTSTAYAQGAPGRFVTVDEAIRVPVPTARNYTIFVGFDESR
jgi:hypothetical protein